MGRGYPQQILQISIAKATAKDRHEILRVKGRSDLGRLVCSSIYDSVSAAFRKSIYKNWNIPDDIPMCNRRSLVAYLFIFLNSQLERFLGAQELLSGKRKSVCFIRIQVSSGSFSLWVLLLL